MASATMAGRLVDAAEVLMSQSPRSTAFRRRAVSTAYYAVFHALAKLCADYVTRSQTRSAYEYLRVYRALDHGSSKIAFGQTPLKDSKVLDRIGRTFVRLQAERHRADYMPPAIGLFTQNAARELVELARLAVSEIESIKPNNKDCRLLATCLLFKERKT